MSLLGDRAPGRATAYNFAGTRLDGAGSPAPVLRRGPVRHSRVSRTHVSACGRASDLDEAVRRYRLANTAHGRSPQHHEVAQRATGHDPDFVLRAAQDCDDQVSSPPRRFVPRVSGGDNELVETQPQTGGTMSIPQPLTPDQPPLPCPDEPAPAPGDPIPGSPPMPPHPVDPQA